ncbi:MAG: ribonuclease PH [Nitrospinae bacterium]|nr:ribonuclease PH [Nitrospinota bacterium]
MTTRANNRAANGLRPITIETGVSVHAEGSAYIRAGNTHVLCAASVENTIPPFLKGSGQGWVTAEYAMLPRATNIRTARERKGAGGRTMEIQRLIGRSLRAVVSLPLIGERTVTVDCDVIQADGGTRTAAITGAYVALALALRGLVEGERIARDPMTGQVAAVSVGVIGGAPTLDLDYSEDSAADVDMNVVMTGEGAFVEVQGTAEKTPFHKDQLDTLLDLAAGGVRELFAHQNRALGR